MNQADLVVYGTLVTVAAIVALIVAWGVRQRRRDDVRSRSLTAQQVRDMTVGERVGDRFLWCIWQDRLSAVAFQMHVFDETGATRAVATSHFVPRDGVLVTYALDGEQRRCVAESLASKRTLLVAPGSDRPLMVRANRAGQERLLGPDGRTERCRVGPLSLRNETRALVDVAGREIGRLFLVRPLDYHVRVLSVRDDALTLEEQVFILLGFGRR